MSERANPTNDVGLVLGDDGIVYEVASDGTRTALGNGGSGAALANVARISLANCPSFDAGTKGYRFQPGDLTIASQTGSDFSLGLDPDGHVAVMSAAGGVFAAAVYVAPPNGVTLDAGSDAPRWMWTGLQVGDNDLGVNPFPDFGIDASVPIQEGNDIQSMATLFAGVPGRCAPGGTALWGINISTANLTGTDAITNPTANFSQIALWLVGT